MGLKDLMSEKSEQSMMRFAVFFTLIIAGVLGLVLGAVLIIRALQDHAIDWSGCAVFLAAIGATITGVSGMKAIQKGKEKKE